MKLAFCTAMVGVVLGVTSCTPPENSDRSSADRSRTDPPAAPADRSTPPGTAKARESVPLAMAVLAPASGSKVRGTVNFIQDNDKVRVEAIINGLTPGKHGFHIHEKGDCSAPDASSAGGHFNPAGTPHGGPDGHQRHVGDFGNVEAD